MSSHTPTSYDVNSCHRHVKRIHIYHMNSSSIIWKFRLLLEQCLESIWIPLGVSSTCVYQMVWLWYGSLNFCCQAQTIALHTNIKLSEKLVPRTFAQNVLHYRQWILLLSFDFVQLLWVTDPAYSVVFFESFFMWMNIKSFIKYFFVFLQHFKVSLLFMCI